MPRPIRQAEETKIIAFLDRSLVKDLTTYTMHHTTLHYSTRFTTRPPHSPSHPHHHHPLICIPSWTVGEWIQEIAPSSIALARVTFTASAYHFSFWQHEMTTSHRAPILTLSFLGSPDQVLTPPLGLMAARYSLARIPLGGA